MSTTELSVSQILPSQTNPRQHFDEASLKELAADIKQHGVIHPILVRPLENGKHEIVVGERRWRAAKIAGLTSIPARTQKLDDKTALEVQLVENLQRADVEPLDEAIGMKRLMDLDPAQNTVDALAARLSKSRRHIYARLQLVALSKQAKQLLAEGVIDASHAMRLAPLPHANQDQIAERLRAQHKREGEVWSVRQLDRIISQNMHALAGAPFKVSDETLPRTWAGKSALGPCTTCQYNTKVSPEAYPDEKPNRCMVPQCYTAKVDATVARNLKALEEKGVKPLRVFTQGVDYSQRQELAKSGAKVMDTYSSGESAVRESKPNAKGARPAVVVAGEDVGQVRWVVPATTEAGTTRRATKSDADIAKEKAERMTALINSRTKRELLEQVRVRARATDKSVWTRVLHSALERSYDTAGTLVALGWTETKSLTKHGSEFDRLVAEKASKMSVDELAGTVLFTLLFTKRLDADKWNNDGRLELLAVAKHFKIDVAAIRARATADLKKKEKEKAPAPKAEKLAKKSTATKKR